MFLLATLPHIIFDVHARRKDGSRPSCRSSPNTFLQVEVDGAKVNGGKAKHIFQGSRRFFNDVTAHGINTTIGQLARNTNQQPQAGDSAELTQHILCQKLQGAPDSLHHIAHLNNTTNTNILYGLVIRGINNGIWPLPHDADCYSVFLGVPQ